MRYLILVASIPLSGAAYLFGANLSDTQATGILSAMLGVSLCGIGALGLGVLVLAGVEKLTRGG